MATIETNGDQPNIEVLTGKQAKAYDFNDNDVVTVLVEPKKVQPLKEGNKMKHIATTGGYKGTGLKLKDGKETKEIRFSCMYSVYNNVKKG